MTQPQAQQTLSKVDILKRDIAHNRSILIEAEDVIASYFNDINNMTGDLAGNLDDTIKRVKEIISTLRS